MTIIDIAHDIQVFIDLSILLAKKYHEEADRLKTEYGVTIIDFDADEYRHCFTLGGENFAFDLTTEELYPMVRGKIGLYTDEETTITEGPAFEYASAHCAVLHSYYQILQNEMTWRGWEFDHEDYGYDLWKDGWCFSFPYFADSWEEVDGPGGGEIEYEPDQPGYYHYRPTEEIIQDACRSLILASQMRNIKPFKLSDLEASS